MGDAMNERRFSYKRKRAYRRIFDYDEARKMYNGGMTQQAVAAILGVTRAAVGRALRNPHLTATEPVFVPAERTCPLCGRPRSEKAQMCLECRKNERLSKPLKLLSRPRRQRVTLAGVEPGRIVKIDDRYAVVEWISSRNPQQVLHYWDGPSEVVEDPGIKVDVLGYKEFEGGGEAITNKVPRTNRRRQR